MKNKKIFVVIILFSVINIIYSNLTIDRVYYNYSADPHLYHVFMGFIVWSLMANLFKKYILDSKKFDFKTVFVDSPLLGTTIYSAINLVLFSTNVNWHLTTAAIDIFSGASMFSIVALICFMFKDVL